MLVDLAVDRAAVAAPDPDCAIIRRTRRPISAFDLKEPLDEMNALSDGISWCASMASRCASGHTLHKESEH
jgi:hypothetical protein